MAAALEVPIGAALESQGGWGSIFTAGVVTWNVRGLWVSRIPTRGRKLGVLLDLLGKYRYVFLQ